MSRKKNRNILPPVMSYIVIIGLFLVFSSFLFAMDVQNTYDIFSAVTRDYSSITERVVPMFNLSGIKYIFTNSVQNFANFPVLINIIIILIGIGIMDKSGFLQTSVTLLTKKSKKTTVTFVLAFSMLCASFIGDLAFVIFIPLTSLFFYYGKRNPFIGVILSYASLCLGNGLSIIMTSVDSELRNITLINASVLQESYEIGVNSLLLINLILIFVFAYFITRVTENYISKIVPKFDFSEEELKEDVVTNPELKGIIYAIFSGIIYLLIMFYSIIPGLPFSGTLLDNSQILYIDKLFSSASFFSNGFVFIVTMFFIILGLFYGIGSKSIRNSNEFIDALGYRLDGIGKSLLLIFVASICLSVLAVSNIGVTICVYFSNVISNVSFVGIPLLLLLFIFAILSTLLLPSSSTAWSILATSSVPAFMNAGLSPEFAQIIFRIGESISLCISPFAIYFILYLAYMQKFSQEGSNISISKSIRYILPYALVAAVIFVVLMLVFYITNIPLGIGGAIAL